MVLHLYEGRICSWHYRPSFDLDGNLLVTQLVVLVVLLGVNNFQRFVSTFWLPHLLWYLLWTPYDLPMLLLKISKKCIDLVAVQNPICWCWPSRTRSTKLGIFTWPPVPTSIHHNLLRPTWTAILWNDTPAQWSHPMPPLPNNSNWTKRTRVCLRRKSPVCTGLFHGTV